MSKLTIEDVNTVESVRVKLLALSTMLKAMGVGFDESGIILKLNETFEYLGFELEDMSEKLLEVVQKDAE